MTSVSCAPLSRVSRAHVTPPRRGESKLNEYEQNDEPLALKVNQLLKYNEILERQKQGGAPQTQT